MGDTLDERSLHQHGNLAVKGFGKTNLACGDEASNKLELTLDDKMFSCDVPSATHRPSMLTVPRPTEDLPHEGGSSFALVQHSVEDTKDEIPENVTSEECAESSLQSNKEISGNLTDQFPAENSTPSNDAEILPICVPDTTQSTDVRSSQDTAETKQGSESEGQIRQVSDSKKHLASCEDSSMGKHVEENIPEVLIQVSNEKQCNAVMKPSQCRYTHEELVESENDSKCVAPADASRNLTTESISIRNAKSSMPSSPFPRIIHDHLQELKRTTISATSKGSFLAISSQKLKDKLSQPSEQVLSEFDSKSGDDKMSSESLQEEDSCSVSAESQSLHETTSFGSAHRADKSQEPKSESMMSETETDTVEKSATKTGRNTNSPVTESKEDLTENSISESQTTETVTHSISVSEASENKSSCTLSHPIHRVNRSSSKTNTLEDKSSEPTIEEPGKEQTYFCGQIEWTFANQPGHACGPCVEKSSSDINLKEASSANQDDFSATDKTYSFSLQQKYLRPSYVHPQPQNEANNRKLFPHRHALNQARENFFKDTPPEGASFDFNDPTAEITSTVGNRSRTATDQSTGQMTISEDDMTEITFAEDSFSQRDKKIQTFTPQQFGDSIQERKPSTGDVYKKVSFSDVLVCPDLEKQKELSNEHTKRRNDIKGILKPPGSKAMAYDPQSLESSATISGETSHHCPSTFSPIDPDSLRSDSSELLKRRKKGLFSRLFHTNRTNKKQLKSVRIPQESAVVEQPAQKKPSSLFKRIFGKKNKKTTHLMPLKGTGSLVKHDIKLPDCKFVSIEVHQNFIELPSGLRLHMGDGAMSETWLRNHRKEQKITLSPDVKKAVQRYESGGIVETEGDDLRTRPAIASKSQCLIPQKHDVAQINSALSKLTDISPKTDKAAGGEPPMGSSPWPGFPWSNYPLFGQNVVTPSEDSMIPEPGSTRTTLASNSGSSCVSQQTSVCGGLGFEAIEGMDPRYQAIFSELQEHSHSTPLKKNNTLPSPNDSPSATAKIKKLESVSRSKLTSTKPMWEDSSAASLRASNTSETLSVDENSQYLPAARMRAGKIFDD